MGDDTKTPRTTKKAAARRGPAPVRAEVAERLRKVHLLVIPAAHGNGVLNMEAFTGESAARRELDNRIDDGWRYLALTPGEPFLPIVAEAVQG